MKKILWILIIVITASNSFLSAATRPDWLDLKNTPIKDVRFFGAKGNGSANDTAAFVAALASGSVYVPAGHYILDSNALTINKLGQSLSGDGIDKTILDFSSGSGTDIAITMNASATPAYLGWQEISGVTIIGNGDGNGIFVERGAKFFLDKVEIFDFTQGLILNAALISDFTDVSITSCGNAVEFRDNAVAPYNLISFNRLQVQGCENVIRCNLTALTPYGGASGIVFRDGQFEGNGTPTITEPLLNFQGNIGGIGVSPTVSFYDCWFEGNTASAPEVLFLPSNSYTGFNFIGNQMYSTKVKGKLSIQASGTAILSVIGNGLNGVLESGDPNVYIGEGATGIIAANLLNDITVINPRQGLIVQDANGFLPRLDVRSAQGIAFYTALVGTSYIKDDAYQNMGIFPATKMLHLDGGLQLIPIASNTALTDTLYIDSTSKKLRFKDIASVSHDLY